jgi:hypothetical protein
VGVAATWWWNPVSTKASAAHPFPSDGVC